MFGHQDDVQPVNTTPAVNQPVAGSPSLPTDNTYLAQPVTNNSNPPLLEEHEADGFTGNPPVSAPAPVADAGSSTVGDSGGLLDIKQQALQQLSPLVGHLEQSPDEKFRTTMMMIQASDNKDLIPAAYEAANQITDEKARAQALLDIINEINYFTQHQT